MAELPHDPVERQKLALIAELHQNLLNYRNAQRGWESADASRDITMGMRSTRTILTYLIRLKRVRALVDTVLGSWIEPRVKQTLPKTGPRKVKTPSQAHQLQGVLVYYFTYVENNSLPGR